jgi:hypothetical protein
MLPAPAESFELRVPPEAAIARVRARLGPTDTYARAVTFREHRRPDRFYLDCWREADGVQSWCRALVTVQPAPEGCVLTLAAIETPREREDQQARAMLLLWLALLPLVWATGAVWWMVLPVLHGAFRRASGRVSRDEYQREIVAALGEAVAQVRRGGYRTLAPEEPRVEEQPVSRIEVALPPEAAVTHAVARLAGKGPIFYREGAEPDRFLVERRRRPGEPGRSTFVEVTAQAEGAGCRLELRPYAPSLLVSSSRATLVGLYLGCLFLGPYAAIAGTPVAVAVYFARKRRRQRLQEWPGVAADRAEIEEAVRRAFASVGRASLPAAKDGALAPVR